MCGGGRGRGGGLLSSVGAGRAGEIEERVIKLSADDAKARVGGWVGVVVAQDVPPYVVLVEDVAADVVPISLRVVGRGDCLAFCWTAYGPAGFGDPDWLVVGDVLDCVEGAEE